MFVSSAVPLSEKQAKMNFKRVLLTLVVLVATCMSAHAQDGPQWEYCSGDQYAFSIDNVDIDPYPIQKGAMTSFSLSGNTRKCKRRCPFPLAPLLVLSSLPHVPFFASSRLC